MSKTPKKYTGKLGKIRSKAGESDAYTYKNVKAKDYAGPNDTYPINTIKRGRAALAYAHDSPEGAEIRSKVHTKYPSIDAAKKPKKKK